MKRLILEDRRLYRQKFSGDGSVTRDYVHIEDAVKAILNIANYRGDFKVFNVGSGKGYSVNGVIHIIEKVLGKKWR